MKRFSWYTIIHPGWHEGEPPLFRLVGPAILPDERTCDIYFKPNRKGGHRHNHIYNACHRIVFRGKAGRRVDREDKTRFVATFYTSIMLNKNSLNDILKKKWRKNGRR